MCSAFPTLATTLGASRLRSYTLCRTTMMVSIVWAARGADGQTASSVGASQSARASRGGMLDLLDAIRRATAQSCAPRRRPLARVHHCDAYNDSDAACHVPVLLGGLGPYQFRWVHGNRRPSNVPSVVR